MARQTVWFINPPPGEDSLQLFKEEKTESAVYNIYLKKVRYNTPEDVRAIFPPPPEDDSNSKFYLNIASIDDNDKASYLQWRLEEIRVVKAGTLDKLVEHLSCASGEVDSTYVSVFLATYRTFASPKQVLNLIQERYKALGESRTIKQFSKEGHWKCIKTVLKAWLDNYPEDFQEPPNYPCLNALAKFAHKYYFGTKLDENAQILLQQTKSHDPNFGPIEVEDYGPQLPDCQHLAGLLDDLTTSPDTDYTSKFTKFEDIPPSVFAEQLTYIDAELFKRVLPHHCLGSIWSRRDKKRNMAQSVMATVNQFNAVSYRVVAIILKHPQLSEEYRAGIIERWIDIAQELRKRKNFSSLKAILSALQSIGVYRLKAVWDRVSREKMDLFEEHAEIFSEENNQQMSRELLILEGTAKFANPETTNTIRGHKKKTGFFNSNGRRKSTFFEVSPIVQGTIPYLGTFLTDLTMVDTATSDTNPQGLINFEKKRKEFEILAQIRLLQSAANVYKITPCRGFYEWFQSIRIYDDKESSDLSYSIQPSAPSANPGGTIKGHKKKPSLGFFAPRAPVGIDSAMPPSPAVSDDRRSVQSNPEIGTAQLTQVFHHSNSTSSVTSKISVNSDAWNAPETKVVKVMLECPELDDHCSNYKSILLNNIDHTKTVISNILLKFNISDSPDEFILFQLLPEKELQLPEKGNVYYAINTSVPDVIFLVRRKSDLEKLKSGHLKGRPKRRLLSGYSQ